jgi:hypothetical protein
MRCDLRSDNTKDLFELSKLKRFGDEKRSMKKKVVR